MNFQIFLDVLQNGLIAILGYFIAVLGRRIRKLEKLNHKS